MKKSILIFVALIIVHFTFIIEDCICQWEPDVRLTNDPYYSATEGYRNVAAIGVFVHVVWSDYRNGINEIYYKRSTNGGTNWEADVRLSNDNISSWYPCVSVSGTFVHVMWIQGQNMDSGVYYKRSTDCGLNWGTDIMLRDSTGSEYGPSVAVSESNVHLVWRERHDVYYKRSTDGGQNWGTDIRLTDNPSYQGCPSVDVSGSVVHVVWEDERHIVNKPEIYYKRSTDGGVNWGEDIRLTNDPASSVDGQISVSGSILHVVWNDYRDGNREIYYKRSTDGGVNWGTDTRLTNAQGNSDCNNLIVAGLIVHVVWNDNRDGNFEIYYKRSTDGGANWEADLRLTNASASSSSPSVALSGSIVHVVWNDERHGLPEIYYKRNLNGNPTKIVNINSEISDRFALEQNYPNPFNANTIIRFQIKDSRFVKLKVFDMLGREVATLVNEYMQAGTYEVRFDAKDLPSGVYFYRLETDKFSETKIMALMK